MGDSFNHMPEELIILVASPNRKEIHLWNSSSLMQPSLENCQQKVLADNVNHYQQGLLIHNRDRHHHFMSSKTCFILYPLQCLVNSSNHFSIRDDCQHLDHIFCSWVFGPYGLLSSEEVSFSGHSLQNYPIICNKNTYDCLS